MPRERENQIKSIALETGFSLAGIAPAGPPPRARVFFDDWLGAGNHAEMTWLERSRDKRRDPSLLLDGARSVVCVALDYYLDPGPGRTAAAGRGGRGLFSIYAQGPDYHRVFDEKLEELKNKLERLHPGMKSLACADTRPVSDRTYALAGGIGWLGKNTSVISPRYGSWIFLGELITDLDLEPDDPLDSLCADCRLCIDACPTGALVEPFVLDARRCISYLTVEKRGEIAADLREKIGNRVFGCDTCQLVCPFNGRAEESAVFCRSEGSPLAAATLDELEKISDLRFYDETSNSAIRRCGPDGMRRNAAIVRRNVTTSEPRPEGKRKK